VLLTAISTAGVVQGKNAMGPSEANAPDQPIGPSSAVTAIVGDDHEAARSRIREILEEMGIRVIAESTNGELLLDAVARLRPQLVTVDMRMPGLNGLIVTERVKQSHPEIRVFIVTNYPNEHYRRAAEKVGADAFIAKADAYAGLKGAIQQWRGSGQKGSKGSSQTE